MKVLLGVVRAGERGARVNIKRAAPAMADVVGPLTCVYQRVASAGTGAGVFHL